MSRTALGEDASRTFDRLPDRLFDDERTRLGAVGVVVAGIGLVALAGLPGVVAAVLLAVAWILLPATYAFAVGQIALVALASDGALVGFAAVEVGLLGVLLAPATRLADPVPPVALAVAWVLAGVALAWASTGAGAPLDPWLAGLALVTLTALAAYVVHRYQLVALGLVADDSPDRADDGDADDRNDRGDDDQLDDTNDHADDRDGVRPEGGDAR